MVLTEIVDTLEHSPEGELAQDIFKEHFEYLTGPLDGVGVEVMLNTYNFQNTGFAVFQYGTGLRGQTPNIHRLDFLPFNGDIGFMNNQYKKIEEIVSRHNEAGVEIKSISPQ